MTSPKIHPAAPAGGPNPIDTHVGARLKMRRTLLGMSQDKLAEAVGVTFQQIQKYENGANRVGASRLFEIGNVLDVPVAYFFDQYMADKQTPSTANSGLLMAAESTPNMLEDDVMSKKETLDLVRAYYNIPNPKTRKKMLEMLKSLAD